jgi:ribonuclease P protein component
MLPRNYRFPLRKELKRIKKSGKRTISPNFSLLTENRKDQEKPLVAIIVSSKVSKKAVSRNKIKRQMNACLRELIKDIDQNTNLVFFVKKKALLLNYIDLKKSIIELFKKSGVFKKI